MDEKCYVKSVAMVSCQKPLSDEWMTNPCICEQSYARAQEPDTKAFIAPPEARRMSKILKRAICTAKSALNTAKIQVPEAIITGTGMGCMENSEKFLIDMAKFGEECLKPTLFMQSTHNTIGSLIAIALKCHGYNNTYSHKGISFESALSDGLVQMRLGAIRNALAGSHDEVTPFTSKILEHTHPRYRFVSETSVSAVIADDCEDALCELESVEILHRFSPKEVAAEISEDKDVILLSGLNGTRENDSQYSELVSALTFSPVCLQYKNVFGENFSSSAAAFYAAVKILEKQTVPPFMTVACEASTITDLPRITVLNSYEESTWSIIRLKKI